MSGPGARLAALLAMGLLLAAGAVAAGCGDDEPAVEPTGKSGSSGYGDRYEKQDAEPGGDGGGGGATDGEAGERPSTGGAEAPGGKGGSGGSGSGGTAAEDTAEHDVPPPAGSPEEAFEKECERDPKACG